jgi:hypothetical protein
MTGGQSQGDTERKGYVLLFRVLFNEDRTRIETEHDVMGWGIRFPSGWCYVDWNREAYAPEDRLDHPHVSVYGSFCDVEQGTGGDVEVIHEQTVHRSLSTGTDRSARGDEQ